MVRSAPLVSAAMALAFLLSSGLASAAGFDLHDPVAVTSGKGASFARNLVATGPHSLVLAYVDDVGGRASVFVRRSANEGDLVPPISDCPAAGPCSAW